jgi:hypothetical protein
VGTFGGDRKASVCDLIVKAIKVKTTKRTAENTPWQEASFATHSSHTMIHMFSRHMTILLSGSTMCMSWSVHFHSPLHVLHMGSSLGLTVDVFMQVQLAAKFNFDQVVRNILTTLPPFMEKLLGNHVWNAENAQDRSFPGDSKPEHQVRSFELEFQAHSESFYKLDVVVDKPFFARGPGETKLLRLCPPTHAMSMDADIKERVVKDANTVPDGLPDYSRHDVSIASEHCAPDPRWCLCAACLTDFMSCAWRAGRRRFTFGSSPP